MKKIISTLLIIMIILAAATTSTFASSKYIKVKRSTYNKKIAQIKDLKKQVKDKNEQLSWLWTNVRSLGFTYKKKVWTQNYPTPDKFYINGIQYTVNLH